MIIVLIKYLLNKNDKFVSKLPLQISPQSCILIFSFLSVARPGWCISNVITVFTWPGNWQPRAELYIRAAVLPAWQPSERRGKRKWKIHSLELRLYHHNQKEKMLIHETIFFQGNNISKSLTWNKSSENIKKVSK